jgi:C4-dicarboxylate-specific signal transduction histidine kinase
LQALIIFWLLYEHHRRHAAEVLARSTMAELHNVNRLAAAGELSASIAHEVKQPLAAAAANAYAARNWLAPSKLNVTEALSALGQIITSIYRANDVVTGVTAIFKSEDERRELVDINNLILSVLTTLQINLRRHGIDVQTQLDDDIPLVEGNKVQLQQVILNLVVNAIDAMQSSNLRELRVRSARGDSGNVRITIEDTGPGIEPDNLDQIFKPLFTTKVSGMGMGLSISRSIVEAHGGHMRASAASHGGAIFEVELPGKRTVAS